MLNKKPTKTLIQKTLKQNTLNLNTQKHNKLNLNTLKKTLKNKLLT